MTSQQLQIPEKIKVGFQKREDTYTKKLAYVIYYDQKGTLRKEKSWDSWRDHKIAVQDIENVPTQGFVLNKKVGGYRSEWNYRAAHIRVYDPRDFEFEISVPNLLFILTQCDCSRGKGLEGEFVYAWEGTELVLLPISSQEYVNSKKFMDLQAQGVKSKEMIPGASYMTKRQESLIFVGRFNYYFLVNHTDYTERKGDTGIEKRWVFRSGDKFLYLKDLKTIAKLQSDAVAPNYAELVDEYNKSAHGSPVKRLYLDSAKVEKTTQNYYDPPNWYFQDTDGSFVECRTHERHDKVVESFCTCGRYTLKDGIVTDDKYEAIAYPSASYRPSRNDHWPYGYGYSYNRHNYKEIPWIEPTKDRLYAEFESGTKLRLCYGVLSRDR